MSFTHKDHMKIYPNYGGEYKVEMGRCERMPFSFKDECIETARLIREKANGQDIWVSLSGGVDSEFVVRVFLEAGIPVKVATNVFKHGYNEYDNYYARKFCNDAGIKLHEFELDIEKFWDNNLEEYGWNTMCQSPQFLTHMWLWDQLDGFVVGGHGDPIFRRTGEHDGWVFRVQEKEDAPFRWAQWRDRDCAPGFYNYTPEILLSFMLEKEISNLLMYGEYVGEWDVMYPKIDVYNKIFKLEPREKKTGFETVMHIDKPYRDILEDMLPPHRRFHQPIQEFIKSLWPNVKNTI